MQLFYGVPQDIEKWMELVTQIRWNFPGLESQEDLEAHKATVLRFMEKRQAICVKAGGEIAGVMLFSRGRSMICCLGVSPDYRRRGVASMLMNEALQNLDRTREISVCTFRADDEKGAAPRALYEKYGFIEGALVEAMGYPQQEYRLYPAGSERGVRQMAVNRMVHAIGSILSGCEPSVYVYGSAGMGDFQPGGCDIDLLVLTAAPISEKQAQLLVGLRQTMLADEPGNPYYRLFEGGMTALDAFLSQSPSRAIYWGTGGEQITDRYTLDCFGTAELMDSGILLRGPDIRSRLRAPDCSDLYTGVKRHYETIRKYAQKTARSLYAFGWMLDIARCLYTLRTGKIIAKTTAAEWALQNGICPVPEALETAQQVRRSPSAFQLDERLPAYAESLAGPIQRFADVLAEELSRFAPDGAALPD